jgi:hypothetical protein
MEQTMATETVPLSKKSGKGTTHGVMSELTAFFTVQPGHEQELRAACQRFGEVFQRLEPMTLRSGLRDMKHVIFDNGQRLLFITSFETDWDAYVDDAVSQIGVEHWIDWMRHTVEVAQLRGAVLQTAGVDPSGKATPEQLKRAVTMGSSELKQVLQDAQVRALYYFNDLSTLTVPQIKKAQRLEQAFQQVLDNPAAAQALQQQPLRPLLEHAAD